MIISSFIELPNNNKKGEVIMSNHVYDLLVSKGIEVTTEESILLQSQWEMIQALKKDLDEVIQDTDDIALTHVANKVYKYE